MKKPIAIQLHTIRPILFLLLIHALIGSPTNAAAFEWTPSDEEIKKYRKSWNPFSHGPVLLQAVDIQPQGQLSVREFLFTQIGEHSYGNQLSFTSERKTGPVHVYSISPSVNTAYGLTDHIELGLATALNGFWARDTAAANRTGANVDSSSFGWGDTSMIVKYRPIVQDPGGWRPSITHFSQLVLPTSKWLTDTQRPPGGFSPLGRLPNTRFGELGITQGLMTRKNLEPIRLNAAVFYTYQAPGSEGSNTLYTGDLINTRLIFEHILDDKKGLGYNIELSTLHGLTWRADGHAINRGQRSGFTIIGVEPAIQWRFWDNWVAAAGVLFTVAGQNATDSIYPNISIFWYWNKTGKVIMR